MSKICPFCKTVNEDEYVYCKNCGNLLENRDNGYDSDVNYTTFGNFENGYTLPVIDGVPTEDIAAFVGAKAPVFIRKFVKSEVIGSKTDWNWPVAVLSFFMGPCGAALWFLYRKMYKIGLLLLIFGFPIFFGPTVINYYSGNLSGFLVETSALPSNIGAGLNSVLLFAVQGVKLLSAIVLSLFADSWYKSFTVRRIKLFHASADARYYRFGLSAIGGTSGGALALGIVFIFSLSFLLSFLFLSVRLPVL